MRSKRSFEVSVGTNTKGRTLDSYTVRGIFGRGLSATADGLNGAACPIQLI